MENETCDILKENETENKVKVQEDAEEENGTSRPKRSYSDSELYVKPSASSYAQQLVFFSPAELWDMLNVGILNFDNLEDFMDDKEQATQLRREYVAKFQSHLEGAVKVTPVESQPPKTGSATANPKPKLIQVEPKSENVVGFARFPLAVTEKILVDGVKYSVPMAIKTPPDDSDDDDDDFGIVFTVPKGNDQEAEKQQQQQNEAGRIHRLDVVSHVNRGICACVVGVKTRLLPDLAKLSAIIEMPSAGMSTAVLEWFEIETNLLQVKQAFESTSEILSLVDVKIKPFGRRCSLRFSATIGDSADRAPILEKGIKAALSKIGESFTYMKTVFASVNLAKRNGKLLVAESLIPAERIKTVLNTRSKAMVEQNRIRNHFGFGRNIAAQVVTAIFVATGQELSLISRNSRCGVEMYVGGLDGEDLYITVTMPLIQISTVGGGTENSAPFAGLELLKIEGPNPEIFGENGSTLARVICGCVLVAELSSVAELSLDLPAEPESTLCNPAVFPKPSQ